MRRFYFHLATDRGLERDDTGSPCATVEHATLEAWRSACEISVDLLRLGQSPMGHCFEVYDDAGHLVFELPFSELLAMPARPSRGDIAPSRVRLEESIANCWRLQAEVTAVISEVRGAMATTLALLAQAD